MLKSLDSWYTEEGRDNDIVIYTKCSIARNIAGFLFPSKMSSEQSGEVLNLISDAIDSFEDRDEFKLMPFKDIDPLALKLLEERGALNNNVSENPARSILIHESSSLYASINMEDHINIASFFAGLDLDNSYFEANSLLAQFQKKLFFAAARDSGFITSDLTNLGSGVKFSVLCSLPSILQSNEIASVLEISKKGGLTVSGYYVQDSNESIGALFSITTGICAGGNEATQMSDFLFLTTKILKMEREARKKILKTNFIKIEDKIHRALAISKTAKLMSFKEAIDIIFKIKWGLNLGLLKGIEHNFCNDILFKTQMGHIAFLVLKTDLIKSNKDITETSIEEYRAKILRDVCESVELV